jgi:hypothetical protein
VSEPRLSDAAVSTYLDALDWVTGLIESAAVGRVWSEPSALARYSTGGVAAHVLGGVLRLGQLLDEPEPIERRPVRLDEFFGPNRLEQPDDDDALFVFLRASAEELAAAGPDALVASCAGPIERLRQRLPTERAGRAVSLVRVPDGQVSLSEYLRTRVLELVVHGDDLVASVPGWVAPEPPSAAVSVCLELCLELAHQRVGGLAALRAFTRSERADPGALRVL